MNIQEVRCTGCKTPLPLAAFRAGELAPCPVCHARIQVEVFPALFRDIRPGDAAEPVLVDNESSCFYHPRKKAVVPCDSCGRFLCALCDVELNGQHLCPACLESGKKKGKLKHLENERTLYDRLALGLATLPLLVWPVTVLTAPMAIYVGIRYWNSPPSLVAPTKRHYVFAIVIGTLELTIWALVLYSVFNR